MLFFIRGQPSALAWDPREYSTDAWPNNNTSPQQSG